MTDNPIGEIVEAGTTQFVAQCLEVPRQIVPRLYDPPPLGAWVKIGRPQETAGGPHPPEDGPHPAAARRPSPVGTGEGKDNSSPTLARSDGRGWREAPGEGPHSGSSEGGILMPGEGLSDEPDPFAAPAAVAPAVLPAAVYALVCGASTSSLEPNRRPSALGYADEDEMRRQQPQIFELLRTEFTGLLVAYSPGDGKALRRYLPPTPPRIHARVYECAPAEVRALTEDMSFLRAILLPSGASAPGVPADELAAACLRLARDAHADDAGFLLRAGKALALLLADDYDRLRALLRNVA